MITVNQEDVKSSYPKENRVSTIQPINDRIIIKPDEAEETTPGGIVLPDNAKERPKRGRVLAVGPGRPLDNGDRSQMDVKEGDHITYSSYAGVDVEVNGEELVVLRQDDVLFVEKP